MPLITGLDPNVALFTAGLGTLLFQIVTRRQVPVFLASSFAFITPIILAKGQFGLAATMGGVMAAGFVYTFLGFAVKLKGTGFIDRLLPPVVIGPVIISIGLAMAPIAAHMAMGRAEDGTELIHYQTAMMISMPALLTTLIVAVFGKGIFRLVPIIAGVLVGFGMAFYFGVVDTAKIAAAPWFAMPHWPETLKYAPPTEKGVHETGCHHAAHGRGQTELALGENDRGNESETRSGLAPALLL